MRRKVKRTQVQLVLFKAPRNGSWHWRLEGQAKSNRGYPNRSMAVKAMRIATGFDGPGPARHDHNPSFTWEGYFIGARRWRSL